MAKKSQFQTCECGKRGFSDERAADRALGRAQHKRNRGMDDNRRGQYRENRFYLCEWSDLYHLTSMSRREHEAVMA